MVLTYYLNIISMLFHTNIKNHQSILISSYVQVIVQVTKTRIILNSFRLKTSRSLLYI
jgi:hypothetical protein